LKKKLGEVQGNALSQKPLTISRSFAYFAAAGKAGRSILGPDEVIRS
jgi:hypothetical protein